MAFHCLSFEWPKKFRSTWIFEWYCNSKLIKKCVLCIIAHIPNTKWSINRFGRSPLKAVIAVWGQRSPQRPGGRLLLALIPVEPRSPATTGGDGFSSWVGIWPSAGAGETGPYDAKNGPGGRPVVHLSRSLRVPGPGPHPRNGDDLNPVRDLPLVYQVSCCFGVFSRDLQMFLRLHFRDVKA